MVSFRELMNVFRELGLDRSRPVIVHASLSSIGEVRGGAESLLGAMLPVTKGIMAPAFTYKTMIIPEVGPENNAISYGSGKATNHLAEFFRPDMPADTLMGVFAETLRKHPNARRSIHPILSFSGVGMEEALEAQTMEDPLAPIRVLTEQEGLVLLIGVDNTVNTSIHYAERLAGRKQFIRWALSPQGVRQCPGFPGCSDGFEQAAPHIQAITRTAKLGDATVRAIPLIPMIRTLTELIKKQPQALLCHKADERCEAVRHSLNEFQTT